jgi:hypothetical protein
VDLAIITIETTVCRQNLEKGPYSTRSLLVFDRRPLVLWVK